MLEYQCLSVTVENSVARVDFNRPRHANSLDGAMWKELRTVFEELDGLDPVRVVVLGGQGRYFCAGIDLIYLAAVQEKINGMPEGRKQEYLQRFIMDLQQSVNAIETCRKPVLASIQGACIGAGLDIAAACDLRYATADTRFSIKEVDLAIVADLGSLQRLPGIVGQGIARELAFSGREFKGQEALTMGLVNKLYPTKRQLSEGVMVEASALAEKSPLTLRGIKESMNFSRDHSVEQGLNFVAIRNAAMLLSKDLEEAVSAYMEKRPALFED